MKYFTIATFFILAVSTASIEIHETNESTPAIKNESPSIIDKTFKTISQFANEAGYAITHLFTEPKNLIKATLKVPNPLSADEIVKIGPADNNCAGKSDSEYWVALYAEKDKNIIEKMIFCPEALDFLKNMDAAKLAGGTSGKPLQDILTALMLRRVTLTSPYLSSNLEEKFLECYHALWERVRTEQETWPCAKDKPCKDSVSVSAVKDNFAAFTRGNAACSEILTDQLTAYAEKVAEAATKHNISLSSQLREAILENLNTIPHFSVSTSFIYDKALEMNKVSAAERIQSVISAVCAILKIQVGGTSTVCCDAETAFNERLAQLKSTSTSVVGIEPEKLQESSEKPPPTTTEQANTSPTKTEKEVDGSVNKVIVSEVSKSNGDKEKEIEK